MEYAKGRALHRSTFCSDVNEVIWDASIFGYFNQSPGLLR